jgi:hypothetical protein
MYAVTVKMGEVVKRLLFGSLSIEIGRAQENDIVLDSKRVSKRHAKVMFNEKNMIVVDLNSANGIFINGEKITQSGMANFGDEIRIATFVIVIDISNRSTEIEERPSDPKVNYLPTLASLRKLIGRILIMDTDFDAFCLDHFKLIRWRFSQNMDRVAKTSILLELSDRQSIVRYLREDFPDNFSEHQEVLIYDISQVSNEE